MELLWREMGACSAREDHARSFDHDDGHLRRLVRLRPGQRAEASDLWITPKTALHGNPRSSLTTASVLSRKHGARDFEASWIRRFRRELLSCFGGSTNLRGSKSQANGGHFGVHAANILREIDNQRGLAFQGMAARPYHGSGR